MPGGSTPTTGGAGQVAATGPAPLTSDVVADECLLGTATLTALLGSEPTIPAANSETARADGTHNRSCFAAGPSATASVNVYRTNLVTPTRYVQGATGARPLAGAGAGIAASVLDTVAGPVLQVGTARHLVTIAVAGRSPTDDEWCAAVRAATAALARR